MIKAFGIHLYSASESGTRIFEPNATHKIAQIGYTETRTEHMVGPITQLAEPEMVKTATVPEGLEAKKRPIYLFLKRAADIVLSLLASILLLIPIGICALVIMCKDPGNPFYVHTRVGKSHKTIKVLKLRTMRKNADKLENMLTPEQLEEYKKEFKLTDDPRLIGYKKPGDGSKCFGARLRQLSIDELPQIIWNVCIKGNMSIVGPRPILQEELDRYYTPEQQEMLLSVKPGLTGYWQAYARNNAMYEDGKRQEMELWYVQNRSLWLDVKIIFATVVAVVKKSGV